MAAWLETSTHCTVLSSNEDSCGALKIDGMVVHHCCCTREEIFVQLLTCPKDTLGLIFTGGVNLAILVVRTIWIHLCYLLHCSV